MTQPQYPQYPQPAPAPKKKNVPLIIGLIGGLLLLVCCGGVIVSVANSDSGKKGIADGKGIKPSTSTSAPAATKAAPAAAPKYVTPVAKDFTLSVRVTKKECFGSAGCNLMYRVYELNYNGDTANLDPNKSYELTYEVRGIEGGPAVYSIETQGGKYEAPDEEMGQVTATQGKKKIPLTVVVTEINEL